MKIAIAGSGYVGLVTAVCLAELGHEVICVEIDEEKAALLQEGIAPIYEPGLEELLRRNLERQQLCFTTDHQQGYAQAEMIYIAVGTPQKEDGSADLSHVVEVSLQIAQSITKDVIVVMKSTVPIGTNHLIHHIIRDQLRGDWKVEIVSNPEFLREGSAIHDAFHPDRIIIGAESPEAAETVKRIYEPLESPMFLTDIRSAEMIKYASNAFLATKISFINEMANLCDKVGARVDEVAIGMGMDRRIGREFLQAGIGYGGSCFPKDTAALINMARETGCRLDIVEAVSGINERQHTLLFRMALQRLENLMGKRIALLGLAFKPNTDDMREAPSITLAHLLISHGAEVVAYDPIAMTNAKALLPPQVQYAASLSEAARDADAVMIVTEWDEFKRMDVQRMVSLMREPLIFDGRNCFKLEELMNYPVEYYSVGRPSVNTCTRTEIVRKMKI